MAATSGVSLDWVSFPAASDFFDIITNPEVFDQTGFLEKAYSEHPEFVKVIVCDLKENKNSMYCCRWNKIKGPVCKNKKCTFVHACILCDSEKHGVMDISGGKYVCDFHRELSKELELLVTQFETLSATYEAFMNYRKNHPTTKTSPPPSPHQKPPLHSAWSRPMSSSSPRPIQSITAPATPPQREPNQPTLKFQTDESQNVLTFPSGLTISGLPEGFTISIRKDATVSGGKLVINTHDDGLFLPEDRVEKQRSLTLQIKWTA